MSRPGVAERGLLAVGVGLPLYAFLYDNANSWPLALGYWWTRLVPMPRQLRIVEIAAVVVLLGWALTHGMSRLTRHLLASALVLVGFAMMSYLHSEEVSLLDAVRLIYMWVLPVMIFIIGRELPWGPAGWKWIAVTVMAWVALSALVSWVQFAVLGYPVGDDITGLNKDAHANGTLMMFAAIHWLSFSLFKRHRIAMAAGLGFLVTMLLSSVLKVMFLGVFAIALLLWLYARSLPSRKALGLPLVWKWTVGAGVAVVLSGMAFTQLDVISSNRLGDFLDKLLSNPQGLGPMQAHQVALSKIGGELSTLAFGVGPFHFANPISVGQVLSDGNLSRKASTDVLAIADEKGEQTRITLTSSLLAEFGIPVFLTAVVMFSILGRALWRCGLTEQADIRWRGAAMVSCGAILAAIPWASLFGSIDVLSVSWPTMLLAGVLCREAVRHDAVAPATPLPVTERGDVS